MKIKKVFDLTQPFYHNCPCWPDLRPPTVEKMLFIPGADANVEMLKTNTHTATHIDAPYHKLSNGKKIDQFPVDTWIGEGIVADVSYVKNKELISVDMLEKAAAHISENDIVMLYTGWGKHRGFNRKYLKDFPGLSEDGARWLVDKKPKLIGTDALSIDLYDLPADIGPIAHSILLGTGVPIIEEVYLEKIAKMGNKRWMFFCLPILLKGAGGSLARVIAIDEE